MAESPLNFTLEDALVPQAKKTKKAMKAVADSFAKMNLEFDGKLDQNTMHLLTGNHPHMHGVVVKGGDYFKSGSYVQATKKETSLFDAAMAEVEPEKPKAKPVKAKSLKIKKIGKKIPPSATAILDAPIVGKLYYDADGILTSHGDIVKPSTPTFTAVYPSGVSASAGTHSGADFNSWNDLDVAPLNTLQNYAQKDVEMAAYYNQLIENKPTDFTVAQVPAGSMSHENNKIAEAFSAAGAWVDADGTSMEMPPSGLKPITIKLKVQIEGMNFNSSMYDGDTSHIVFRVGDETFELSPDQFELVPE